MTIHQGGEEVLESAKIKVHRRGCTFQKHKKEFLKVGVGVPAPVHESAEMKAHRRG